MPRVLDTNGNIKTTVFANPLAITDLPIRYITWTAAGASITVLKNQGVISVTRTGTGLFTIQWTPTFLTLSYPMCAFAANAFCTITSAPTALNAFVATTNSGGTAVDPVWVCVFSFGV